MLLTSLSPVSRPHGGHVRAAGRAGHLLPVVRRAPGAPAALYVPHLPNTYPQCQLACAMAALAALSMHLFVVWLIVFV